MKKLITIFEFYDNTQFFKSIPKLVSPEELKIEQANQQSKVYSNIYEEYESILTALKVTKEQYSSSKFSRVLFVSEIEFPDTIEVKEIIDLITFTETTNPQLTTASVKKIQDYIDWKEFKKETLSMKLFSESDFTQEKSRVENRITVEEPKKQLEHLQRQTLATSITDQDLLHSVLLTLPEITLLTAKQIKTINNNLSYFEKEFNTYKAEKAELDKLIADESNLNSAKQKWTSLKEKSTKLYTIKGKLEQELEDASEVELLEKFKPIHDNANRF